MNDKLPSAPLLRGSVPESFAYYTIKDRLPVILTKIIDRLVRRFHLQEVAPSTAPARSGTNSSNSNSSSNDSLDKPISAEAIAEAKQVIMSEISALKYAMVRDKPIELLSASSESTASAAMHANDVDMWNSALLAVDESQRTWFRAPWLLIECYMYRLLRQTVQRTTNWKDFDLFESEKQASLEGSVASVLQLASAVLAPHSAGGLGAPATRDRDLLRELIQSDLSLLVHAKHDEMHKMQVSGKEQLAASHGNIIVNHTEAVLDKLLAINDGTIVFVLDNAGFELFADLCLADHISQTTGCTIVFEAKAYPWFVSDTTFADFEYTLSECDRLGKSKSNDALVQAVARWRSWLASGRWQLRADPFWTSPFPYWRLPSQAPQLLQRLSEARFIFFKGDLNYRKMVHDAAWPTDTPLADAMGPLAATDVAPFVLLRTCKSDTAVGLAPGQGTQLGQIDKDWMVNGKFGMIQFFAGRSGVPVASE
ncbi:hypothetical protein BC831DRAFT_497492 [Entophlyctis helioformis]|nr:hypothetical protein BC831DRAFT_497492 [Entophlyctis helioformis]